MAALKGTTGGRAQERLLLGAAVLWAAGFVLVTAALADDRRLVVLAGAFSLSAVAALLLALRGSGRPEWDDLIHGVTDLHAAEERLRADEARNRAILDSAVDAILTFDAGGSIQSMNGAAERMFGYEAGEVTGLGVGLLIDEPYGLGLGATEQGDGDGGGVRTDRRVASGLVREAVGRRKDGTEFPLELSVAEIDLGSDTVITGIARDITERKAFERQLAHQATHDPLTGLPNRVLFIDRVEQALARTTRSHHKVAVLFCDLDRFKVVNDSLGHTAGDHLLMTVSDRLRGVVRPSDTVARFGGDEFAVLCEELDSPDDASEIAHRLASALREPVTLDSGEVVVSVSIGIAVADAATDTPETLVRDADAAMYRAKEQGRDRHEVFDVGLRAQAVARLETERALRRALLEGELTVHYQPEVDLSTGRVVGVEALARWNAPGRGLVQPAEFISVAEETGLIVPIGAHVLDVACREAARWHAELGEAAPVLWVNLSGRQLAEPGLAAAVAEAAAHLPQPSMLGLEITESELVPDDERVTGAVKALADLGVRIAIDDFGTGFASLAYLWRFPADVLKIDRTFVGRLGEDRSATVIVASVVQLARTLGKATVAEGVETVAQLAQLRRLGCEMAQGRLLAWPTGAGDVLSLLRRPPDFLDVVERRPDSGLR